MCTVLELIDGPSHRPVSPRWSCRLGSLSLYAGHATGITLVSVVGYLVIDEFFIDVADA
jgi:hypothetical protein